jgi:hypothetical protein
MSRVFLSSARWMSFPVHRHRTTKTVLCDQAHRNIGSEMLILVVGFITLSSCIARRGDRTNGEFQMKTSLKRKRS